MNIKQKGKIMKYESLNVLREKFLSFYESKGHLRLPSFPLPPENDNSLLLINAGMAPLKPYFIGEQVPPRKRVTTCQKCIRTPDIERVGKTARHGTFFEMLGNFSFGDYFKKDAIPWAYEFLTKVLEIPPELLHISIYQDDEEAHQIWLDTGVPDYRIYRMGKEDNFWEIGSGPCGPCSEIYFDRGIERGCGRPGCAPGCDCDRFVEIWNIVFTQFTGDGKGHYEKLANPNIDTGMGLERLACVMQNVSNIFEVDTIRNIMLRVCEIAGVTYEGSAADKDVSLRVITDHIRGSMFLISDGVIPSNEGRGYVLRRLLRRAARHGKLLGIEGPFLSDLCDTAINESKGAYPELEEKRAYIKKTISLEEERFRLTIDSGLSILEKVLEKAKADGKTVLDGADVFKLYDTFGFPIDLTREIASEQGISLDEEGFSDLMREQKERARKARAELNGASWTDDSYTAIKELPATEFTGYTEYASDGEILCIIADGEATSSLHAGEAVIVLDRTPFYGEGGGQVGDTGIIKTATGEFIVTDTKKTPEKQYLHFGHVVSGKIELGKCRAEIDAKRRDSIKRNHSAAHLLQAALKKVLGDHVEQAGSYVDDKRCRFDFTHFEALSAEELEKVEELVNEAILADHEITATEMPIEEAKKTGATALFGEKYGKTVRVVRMGDVSIEFCGGTHLERTGKAGLFKILSENSVAAGVRRIEAITGTNVLERLKSRDELIRTAAAALKVNNQEDIAVRAEAMSEEIKALKKTIEQMNTKSALDSLKEKAKDAEIINGIRLITATFEGLPSDALRNAIDSLKSDESIVCVLASVNDGKIIFAAGCGKEAVKKGAHAGNILKAAATITGGGGGGRPDSATSGGKDPSKLGEAMAKVKEIISAL